MGRLPALAGGAVPELRGRQRRAHRQQPRLDGAAAARSTSSARSASTTASARCSRRMPSARASTPRPASATPSSATRSCRASTTSSCSARTTACCRPAARDQWGNLTSGVDLIHRVEGVVGARDRHAADHEQRRHEVRQERGQRHLARPRDVQPVPDVPVLAQHRRRRRHHAPQDLHVPHARRDRGVRAARRRTSRSAARRRSASRSRSRRSCTDRMPRPP